MQEVSEKYNNDSYRERHALSVERLRTLPVEESVEDSYIADSGGKRKMGSI